MWQIISANTTGKTRRATLRGREYLVATGTMIVPGVLPGSSGKVYYSEEEIETNHSDWNGMPIVVGHPQTNGSYVSARDPDVIDQCGIGEVFNSNVNGKLAAEFWFDVAAVKTYDRKHGTRLYNRLKKGEVTELSTGLFITKLKAPANSVFNGRNGKKAGYDYIARNLKPDHLAILLNEVGACSVKDGCGVFNKQEEQDREYAVNPYAGEHAARVADPGSFEEDSFRRKKITAGVSVILGKRSGSDKMEIQAYRFDAKKFTAAQAKAWLKEHEVKAKAFEKATANQWTPIANAMSFEQRMEAVNRAFRILHPWKPSVEGQPQMLKDAYVMACFDDYLIYREGDQLYRQSYTMDGSKVDFDSDVTPVEQQVDYVPVKNQKRSKPMALKPKERQAIITALTTNCTCFKAKGDAEVLASLSDTALVNLKTNMEKTGELETLANAATEGFTDPAGNKYRYNAESQGWEVLNAEPDDDDDDDDDAIAANVDPEEPEPEPEEEEEETPPPPPVTGRTANKKPGYKPLKAGKKAAPAGKPQRQAKRPVTAHQKPKQPRQMTPDEWLQVAPAPVRRIVEDHRDSLIDQILVNIADEDREGMVEYLANKSFDELEMLAKLPGAAEEQQPQTYVGAGGAFNRIASNGASGVKPLELPTYTPKAKAQK